MAHKSIKDYLEMANGDMALATKLKLFEIQVVQEERKEIIFLLESMGNINLDTSESMEQIGGYEESLIRQGLRRAATTIRYMR